MYCGINIPTFSSVIRCMYVPTGVQDHICTDSLALFALNIVVLRANPISRYIKHFDFDLTCDVTGDTEVIKICFLSTANNSMLFQPKPLSPDQLLSLNKVLVQSKAPILLKFWLKARKSILIKVTNFQIHTPNYLEAETQKPQGVEPVPGRNRVNDMLTCRCCTNLPAVGCCVRQVNVLGYTLVTLVQTDKSKYKAGQLVLFRVVTLKSDLTALEETVSTWSSCSQLSTWEQL